MTSVLKDMYAQLPQDATEKNIQLEQFGESGTWYDLLQRLINALSATFLCEKTVHNKDAIASITNDQVKRANSGLAKIPKDSATQSVFVRFVQMRKDPRIRVAKGFTLNGQYCGPRMTVEFESGGISAHDNLATGISVNTGYILDIPQNAHSRKLDENGKLVIDLALGSKTQLDFIIVPIITANSGATIVPSIVAYDRNDTGLLTINVTLLRGKLTHLYVQFRAYSTCSNTSEIGIQPSPIIDMLFRRKDRQRAVRNCAVRIRAEKATVIDGQVRVPIYHNNTMPMTLDDSRHLEFGKTVRVLMTSRRREVNSKKCITLAGIWDGPRQRFVAPLAYETEDACLENTHCIVGIQHQLDLFGDFEIWSPLSNKHMYNILNGSFVMLDDYKILLKSIKKCHKLIDTLALNVGVWDKRGLSSWLMCDYQMSPDSEPLETEVEIANASGNRTSLSRDITVEMSKILKIIRNMESLTEVTSTACKRGNDASPESEAKKTRTDSQL